MAICKCKMCGGDLHIEETDKVVECEYCGTTQTVPSADSEKKMTLFNRANRLRLANEFDKAAGIYENIIAEFPEEAEAYWGAVLCKYGIEYVDDPATGKKIPTCHRSSFDSVMEDENFEQACENADVTARRVYREEAKRLEEIRKGIIEVSAEEAPYDIFICYKETDENGDRTVDSAIAQDVYTALTEKGYRVFFSRISLEDKLGQEYEPYIFAALNSAKLMLVFGTDYEYFNAVWVKNEWSRFLKLIAAGQKKALIPCYKDIDAYDMPKEFAKLQSQDMGKVGAIQDLLRGIDKIFGKGATQPAQAASVQTPVAANSASATVETLLKRAFMFLEDGNWESADEYAEKVLDVEPENGEAYLVKAMAELQVFHREALSAKLNLEENGNIVKALRFGSDLLRSELNRFIEIIQQKKKDEEKEKTNRIAVLTERRQQLSSVQGIVVAGEDYFVGVNIDGTVVAIGNNNYGQCNTSKWQDIITVVGENHTVGLKKDGTVVATGDNKNGQCNVSDWKDIVSIATGDDYTVGLKSDGTVIAIGNNKSGQCNVANWNNIRSISADWTHTVGLKKDGKVIATGDNDSGQCDVFKWQSVIKVIAKLSHTVGLKKDGTVIAVGENADGECNVSDWEDIIDIAAHDSYTMGLKKDGTVVAAGDCFDIQTEVSNWHDIIYIAAGEYHAIGLKADGTVVSAGNNSDGQCDVSNWTNIVAITTESNLSIGLKSDGTVVVSGKDEGIRHDVSQWKLFDDYRTIEQERKAFIEKEKAEHEAKIAAQKAAREKEKAARVTALINERTKLETELPTLKGIFKAGRRREVEARLAEIAKELEKLK